MRILLYAFFACLIIGVLGVVPIESGNVPIYFIDILAGISLVYVIASRAWRSRSVSKFPTGLLRRQSLLAMTWMLFTTIAAFSLLFTPISLSSNERFISSLYLLRWIAYFSIFLLVNDQKDTRNIYRLRIVGIILAGLGWIQYFLYPNLRNLEYLGWDPHLERIFATYLDPNYFGLLMVLSIILWWITLGKVTAFRTVGVAVLFVTLLFTYSRSSYLALIGAIVGYELYTRRWMAVGIMLVPFVMAILLIPQPRGEGGKLLRLFTFEARLENWRMGMQIVRNYPLLGVGFNTLRYAKEPYLPQNSTVPANNSAAGLDNSFLFVAGATGLVGLIAFIIFLYSLFRYTDVLGKIVLIAVLIHSLFQNSFFFPWVMAWMWIVLGATGRSGSPTRSE